MRRAFYAANLSGSNRAYSFLTTAIKTNRAVLIDQCRAMVASRTEPKAAGNELPHGVPIFLDHQLVETLTIEQASEPLRIRMASDVPRASVSEIGSMAALHGRDLLERGFTLEQVVRDYGDVCQDTSA